MSMTEQQFLEELDAAEGGNEQFVLPHGSMVATGMLRSPDGPKVKFASFPQELMLEDNDIKRLLEKRSIADSRKKRSYRMQNQGQIGSCAARAAVGGHYQVQEMAGRAITPLQPEHLYARVNGGRDGGSMLDRCYQALASGGCSSAGKVPYQSYNRRQQGNVEAADQDGLRFKIHEPYALPDTYDEYVRAIASALARGYPVNIAWHVGAGSMRLRNGFCVVGGGPGNHASFLHDAKWVGGRDLIHGDLMNSWGPVESEVYGKRGSGWGDGGFGLMQMQDIFRTRRYHVHYVLTSVMDDPQGVNPV